MGKSRTDLVKVVLKKLFEEHAWFKSRSWGLVSKKNNPCEGINPFGGSHTTIGIGSEIVTVVADQSGGISVFEYTLTTGTDLGKIVKEALREKGISDFQEGSKLIELVRSTTSKKRDDNG